MTRIISWVFGLGLVGMVIYILYMERQPENQMYLDDTGVVLQAGCVNSTYKGHVTHDCSVEIEMKKEGTIRTVLTIGVLPGDKIRKFCGQRFNQKYRCFYGR